jgi:hypothetical protein
MVLTDVSQLSAECQEWRQILRNYREEFNDCRKALQEICRKSLSKNQLQEVEHFDNQFHIQLINIHDLKQSVKNHERKIQFETSGKAEASEATFAYHEDLLDQFLMLENTLQQLREDFKNFINATNC